MKKLLFLIIVSLMFAGVANGASNVWNPFVVDPNFPLTEAGNWNVAVNWSYGTVPISSDKIGFTNDTVGCIIDSDTSAVSGQSVFGDNGGDFLEHKLTIYGDLKTHNIDPLDPSWSTAGYNRTAHVSVERGGTLTTEHRFGIGLVPSTNPTVASTLNINGGVMIVDGNLQIGTVTTPGHIGLVNIDSGTLDVLGTLDFRDPCSPAFGIIDIRHGILTVVDDPCDFDLDNLIATGNITAFGGTSTVSYEYIAGEAIIEADDPMARWPSMDEWVADGGLTLSWTNLAPVPPAPYVYVDVWFGTNTDPCSGYTRILTKQFQFSSSSTLGASTDPGTYWWQVDTYAYGNPTSTEYLYPGDPNFGDPLNPRPSLILGDQIVFHSTDDEPPSVVIDTLPTVTWKTVPITLTATVRDDGTSKVTVVWTSSLADPNITFTPSTNEILAQADYSVTGIAVTTDVEVNYDSGPFTVTATVRDELNPDADDSNVALHCADNPCAAAIDVMNYDADHPGDLLLEKDCVANLDDLLVLVLDWLYPYALEGPTEIPQ